MTQAVGAHSSYDEPIATGGNREDLSDVLYDVSPTETPFITATKKGKATATAHDWLTDELTPAGDNAHIEGDDATPTDPNPRIRLSNYTQIFKKHAVVTGTQEKVLKGGGIKSEMAYQVARRLKEINRDAERAFIGIANAKVAGDDSTPREIGSFETYMTAETYQGGLTFTPPTGNGVDVATPGTARAIDEDILKAALETLWLNSGGNENILGIVGAHVRGQISTFTGSATRYVTTEDKKLVASINVYDGDFHTVTVTPDRYSDPTSMFLIDPEYVKTCDLRGVSTKDLAVTGDSTRKEIVWECTLEVCNPLGHVQVGALETS
ncbi:MAG: hypothetical protein DRI97_06555 [Bacteroidetes bacterium]|nr:MAG: hypothetical protein DRI97_06555 [Bacteroidota bacterium]